MEEIIRQIVQIDSVAVSNRNNSEQALKEKRSQYEKEMLTYREEKICKAQEKADALYQQIVMRGEQSNVAEIEKCRQLAKASQNRYLEVEADLLDEVFNDLFRVEG
ncbi:MAG: hypothetical protein E7231_06710 [Cellulosilyticum sp.]|nr:hypothetical protein [Cellulosilyticum sp.]